MSTQKKRKLTPAKNNSFKVVHEGTVEDFRTLVSAHRDTFNLIVTDACVGYYHPLFWHIMQCTKEPQQYLEILRDFGVDLQAANDKTHLFSDLITACEPKAARLLVDYGVVPRCKSLAKSIVCEEFDKVKSYISSTADADLALTYAVAAGRLEMVKLIFRNEWRSQCDPQYYFEMAIKHDQLDILQWFILQFRKPSLKIVASELNRNCLRWLLRFRFVWKQIKGHELDVCQRLIDDSNDHLDLAGLELGDSACFFVADVIQMLRRRYVLHPAGLVYEITDGPKSVDLSGNPRITDRGLDCLAKALPEALKKFRELTLSAVSVASLNQLRAAAHNNNITIHCEFPSLLTICVSYVSNFIVNF
jgi:hypothetical protein